MSSRVTGRTDIPQREEKHRFDEQQKARSLIGHRAVEFCFVGMKKP